MLDTGISVAESNRSTQAKAVSWPLIVRSKAANRRSCQLDSLVLPKEDTAVNFKAVAILPADSKQQRRLSAPPGTYSPINTTVVVYTTPPAVNEKKEESEDVTDTFIKEFNERRGNAEYVAKARRMLNKTCILAGLEKSKETTHVDIPSARHNFFLLSKLDHQELKMKALEYLIHLLNLDEITEGTAFDLIPLAINMMKQMDRELTQTQLVEEQIRICEAYGIVTELIQRHYARKHLGGIIAELKAQLIQTAGTLDDLNTHNDPCLHFKVEYAKEGIKRLKDDRKELFEVGERLFHLLVSAASIYANDMMNFSQEIEKVYQGLDVRIKEAWYDAAFLFSELGKRAQNDMAYLIILQTTLKLKVKDLDWKFLYKAIECLCKIAVNGKTREICSAALNGQKCIDQVYPGIVDFIAWKEYKLKTSFKPLVHFKLPVLKDNNVIIRHLCVIALLKVSKNSEDKEMRLQSKKALLNRLKQEHDFTILQLLTHSIPRESSTRLAWALEAGSYAVVPKKETHAEGDSKEPSSPIEKVAIRAMPSKIASNSIPVLESAPEASSAATNSPETTNRLNKISEMLGVCIGLSPQIVQDELEFNGDIFPLDDNRLNINRDGMQQILRLIVQYNEVKSLNFSMCKFDEDTLLDLTDFIQDSYINSLTLSNKFSKEAAQRLSEALKINPDLKIEMNIPEGYLQFGSALLKNGLVEDALKYYEKGLQLLEGKEDQVALKSKFFCKIGQAELIAGKTQKAESSLKNSLELNGVSVKTNLHLAKLYRAQSRRGDALKYVEKALEIKPDDKTALELAAQYKEK